MEPWRKFLGEIKLKCISGKKNDKQKILLLTDHIILASGHNKPKFKGKIHLANCWVVNMKDTDGWISTFI